MEQKWELIAGAIRCVRAQLFSTGVFFITENAPTVVYIYEFSTSLLPGAPKLRSILVQDKPMMQTSWNPIRKGVLTLCCGGSCLYTWSDEWTGEDGKEEEMAECIGVPASMSVF